MELTWFIGRAQCGARRSARQDDSETGCRSPDAYDTVGSSAVEPLILWPCS